MAERYLNFDLSLEAGADGLYKARVLAAPAGQAETDFRWPFTEQDVEMFVLRMGQSRSGARRKATSRSAHARDFGRQLYDTVFADDVGTCFIRSLDAAERVDKGLRIRFSVRNCPDLVDVPWEYLYVTPLNRFLVVSSQTPLVRYVDLARSIRPLAVTPPLRVLVVVSNPSGVAALQVDHEWDRIRNAVTDLEESDLLKMTRLPSATLADLQNQLREEDVHILHFIGHGDFDKATGRGVLYFENEDGGPEEVTSETLATVLHDHRSLRLVILNSCEGARSSAAEPFSGTAIGLVGQGVPAVVSMQFEISDRAAIEFAHEFYQAVADHYPVDAAVGEARKRVFAVDEGGNEWGTPVLHMRSPDGRLFEIQSGSGPRARRRPAVADQQEPSVQVGDSSTTPVPTLNRRALLTVGVAGVAAVAGIYGLRQLGGGEPLTSRWSFATDGQIFSSPAVNDGLVYVGSNDRRLYCIDAATGEERWRYVTGGDVTSSPVVKDNLVYVGSNDGLLHAVDSETGTSVWTYATGGVIHSSPAVSEGTVFVGSRDSFVHAVDAATGSGRWRFQGGDWFNSSPTVDRGLLVIGCRDHEVYFLDADTGAKLTNYTTDSTVDSSAAMVGDSVFIGGDDRRLYALRRDASFIWKFEAGAGVVSTPAYEDGVVYFGSDDSFLYAVDATTGRERWRYRTGNQIRSSPVIKNGRVYVGSRDRSVHAVNATTGEVVASFATDGPIDDSSPSVADGRLFVGSLDGSLYSLVV